MPFLCGPSHWTAPLGKFEVIVNRVLLIFFPCFVSARASFIPLCFLEIYSLAFLCGVLLFLNLICLGFLSSFVKLSLAFFLALSFSCLLTRSCPFFSPLAQSSIPLSSVESLGNMQVEKCERLPTFFCL